MVAAELDKANPPGRGMPGVRFRYSVPQSGACVLCMRDRFFVPSIQEYNGTPRVTLRRLPFRGHHAIRLPAQANLYLLHRQMGRVKADSVRPPARRFDRPRCAARARTAADDIPVLLVVYPALKRNAPPQREPTADKTNAISIKNAKTPKNV